MKRFDQKSVVSLVCVALLCLLLLWRPTFSQDETVQTLLFSSALLLLGTVVFICLAGGLEYRLIPKKRVPGSWIVLLPAAAVSVNNAPIPALLSGDARLTRADLLPLLALQCLLIGCMEEIAFRGCLFPFLLEKHRPEKEKVFFCTVVSSAAFALFHLLNLLDGAPAAVLLQVGYSFLIGSMCAVVFLKTENILWCILLHAVYDFGGMMISTLGEGGIWTPVAVAVTVALGVAVGLFFLILLLRSDPDAGQRIYKKGE